MITVKKLVKRFGLKTVLRGVDFEVQPGEFVALLGPNGAGKTTLMRAICGMLPLNLGTVRVAGLDPRTRRDAQRALALVPEEDASPGTISARQLVRYTARHKARARSSLP